MPSVDDIEKRLNELEDTVSRQFNLIVVGIISSIVITFIMWAVPSMALVELQQNQQFLRNELNKNAPAGAPAAATTAAATPADK